MKIGDVGAAGVERAALAERRDLTGYPDMERTFWRVRSLSSETASEDMKGQRGDEAGGMRMKVNGSLAVLAVDVPGMIGLLKQIVRVRSVHDPAGGCSESVAAELVAAELVAAKMREFG